MKLLRWSLLGPLALALALIVLVQLRAVPMESSPPLDRTMVIPSPDGGTQTLGALLDELRSPGTAEPEATRHGEPEHPSAEVPGAASSEAVGAPEPTEAKLRAGGRTFPWDGDPRSMDVVDYAAFHLEGGRPEVAAELLRTLPKDDPRYSRAMRRIGWDCYTKGMDDPRRGIAFVNASLRSDPFGGNAWQDASRVYLRSLGIPMD